jgi:septal ring factor EnvC (AmiA/AmiB activator)
MDPENIPNLAGGGMWSYIGAAIGSLITGGVLGSLALRKRLSADATTIAGDRAEIDIIKTLQDDNNSLRASLKEVNAERDKLWREMAEMTATLKIMEFKMTAIQEELVALRAQRSNSA